MNQNSKDIDESLLLQYLLGNTENEDRRMVENWLDADSGNRKNLDRLEALWLETGRLNPPPLAVDVDKAWERFSERTKDQEKLREGIARQSVSIRFLRYALGAAALILLIFGIYTTIRLFTVKVKEIEMAAGTSVMSDTLPDGSLITLNKQSKLSYPEDFTKEERCLTLTGEAYFKVSKDPLKPFIVAAGRAKVKVLGTVFNVSAYPEKEIRVTVNEGRVLFFVADTLLKDTSSIVLEAGMTGTLKPGAISPEIVADSIPDKLFWVNHTLDFNGTSLAEVFRMLEKYFDVQVSVSQPDILNCRLSASFVNDPADRIMTVIAESFGLKLSMKGKNYNLSGNGCSKGSQ